MTEPTTCPVEECDETVDYTDLIDHLYAEHDAMDLCATVANLVAELEAKEKDRAYQHTVMLRRIDQLPALLSAVSAARVVAKHGDMSDQTRRELTEALNTDA